MRDPELVARAQHAAVRLEAAWERWRALQGLGETPAQPVVGYVGYALKEPWGQPRAVIGFSAEEAERLAEFLERAGGNDNGAADRGLELAQRHVPGQFAVTSAVTPDVLAVTSQLSPSQLRHSFLPGSDDKLRNTRAGYHQPLSETSGLGTARPRPEPRLLFSGNLPRLASRRGVHLGGAPAFLRATASPNRLRPVGRPSGRGGCPS